MNPTQIRQLRERLRLTQKALAVKLHVARETVAQWEGGKQQPHRVHVAAMKRIAGVAR